MSASRSTGRAVGWTADGAAVAVMGGGDNLFELRDGRDASTLRRLATPGNLEVEVMVQRPHWLSRDGRHAALAMTAGHPGQRLTASPGDVSAAMREAVTAEPGMWVCSTEAWHALHRLPGPPGDAFTTDTQAVWGRRSDIVAASSRGKLCLWSLDEGRSHPIESPYDTSLRAPTVWAFDGHDRQLWLQGGEALAARLDRRSGDLAQVHAVAPDQVLLGMVFGGEDAPIGLLHATRYNGLMMCGSSHVERGTHRLTLLDPRRAGSRSSVALPAWDGDNDGDASMSFDGKYVALSRAWGPATVLDTATGATLRQSSPWRYVGMGLAWSPTDLRLAYNDDASTQVLTFADTGQVR